MVEGQWYHQPTRVQVLNLTPVFWIYFNPSRDMRSVGGDVSIDYECVCGDFVNLKMMCRLGHSEVLIGIGCECMCL